MAERLFHETVDMPASSVPVKIFSRSTDSRSKGCRFNWHGPIEFFVVMTGGILLQCRGSRRWLYPGDIGVVNCNEPHRSLKFLDGTTHYLIQADLSGLFEKSHPAFYAQQLAPFRNSDRLFQNCVSHDPQLNEWFRRLIGEYQRREDGSELALDGYLSLIFALLLRRYAHPFAVRASRENGKRSMTYLADILTYIENHYTEEFRLQDLSEKLFLSVPHMCRLFKANTGDSIMQYCNTLRCSRAKLALESGCSVKQTAAQFGFADANYFSRTFKKIVGVPPGVYAENSAGTSRR